MLVKGHTCRRQLAVWAQRFHIACFYYLLRLRHVQRGLRSLILELRCSLLLLMRARIGTSYCLPLFLRLLQAFDLFTGQLRRSVSCDCRHVSELLDLKLSRSCRRGICVAREVPLRRGYIILLPGCRIPCFMTNIAACSWIASGALLRNNWEDVEYTPERGRAKEILLRVNG